MTASWRTTLFGLGGLITVLASTASAIFDGDPATVPNYAALAASAAACIGLLFARDNKVTSAQAGAGDASKTSQL